MKKKNREQEPEEEGEWSRYSRGNRKQQNMPKSSGFRHDPMDRPTHMEHDRWVGGQSRDRFQGDHKRDRFDYPRPGSYHRERDFARADKR